MLNHITIVGLGAMGILFGDLAVKNLGPDRVRFLADGERLERYRRDGARCNGEPCGFRFSDGSDGPAELLVFAKENGTHVPVSSRVFSGTKALLLTVGGDICFADFSDMEGCL